MLTTDTVEQINEYLSHCDTIMKLGMIILHGSLVILTVEPIKYINISKWPVDALEIELKF